MKKLQPEGRYKPLNDDTYKSMINATTIYKLIPKQTKAKFKFAQNITQERFDMILENLNHRETDIDKETMVMMQNLRIQNDM